MTLVLLIKVKNKEQKLISDFNIVLWKVKYWFTMNEPQMVTKNLSAPGQPPVYIAAHNMLLAHAEAYHLYNNTYKSSQNGKMKTC